VSDGSPSLKRKAFLATMHFELLDKALKEK
jgi:hypothetical protein